MDSFTAVGYNTIIQYIPLVYYNYIIFCHILAPVSIPPAHLDQKSMTEVGISTDKRLAASQDTSFGKTLPDSACSRWATAGRAKWPSSISLPLIQAIASLLRVEFLYHMQVHQRPFE